LNERQTKISFRGRAAREALLQASVVLALHNVREERGTHFVVDASEIKGWATRRIYIVDYSVLGVC
jgi:hypothetical protein